MSLIEVLKAESLKNAGKPLLLDDIRMLMNVSREVFDVVLSELVQSGACVLSMDDGCVMIQHLDSSVLEPSVNAVMKSATRGRPVVPEHLRRVSVTFARIPSWMAERMKSEGQAGRKIEKALLHFYNLVPPV